MKLSLGLFILFGGIVSACEVDRIITGTGFHRELQFHVKFQPADTGSKKDDNCSVLLLQPLPTGLYVDLHEVKMKQDHGFAKVYSPERIDIEQPEYNSPVHQVFITQSVNVTDDLLTATVRVLIHLRYHRPSVGGVKPEVILPDHQSFVWCQGENTPVQDTEKTQALVAPCHHSNNNTQMCHWKHLNCQLTADESLTLQVPVGYVEHTFPVIVLTFAAIVLGTGAILLSLKTASKQLNAQKSSAENLRGSGDTLNSGVTEKQREGKQNKKSGSHKYSLRKRKE